MIYFINDLQPKPLTGADGIDRFCRNAKALTGHGSSVELPVKGLRVLRVKIRKVLTGKNFDLPEVTARGDPKIRGKPKSVYQAQKPVIREREWLRLIRVKGYK